MFGHMAAAIILLLALALGPRQYAFAADVVSACDFEMDLCDFDTAGSYSWTRVSGTTPSANTGPSMDHTSGSGFYVFVEASEPNFPSKGPFVLKVKLEGGGGVGDVAFWYNMYGADMGSLELEVSADDSTWTKKWTKKGNLGDTWFSATVSAQDASAVFVRFVGTTGVSNSGDMALDDIEITAWSTEAPTTSSAPSLSGSPSFTPTPRPSPSPTTRAEFDLLNAVRGPEGRYALDADVLLTGTMVLEGLGAVVIVGNGFAVDGQGRVACFWLKNMTMRMSNLTITNGLANFGGAVRMELVTAFISDCVLVSNAAVTDGGAIRMDNSEVTLEDVVIRGNTAEFGGGIVARGASLLRMSRSLVVNNYALYGGGIYVYGAALVVDILESTRFIGNNATTGGAAYVADSATLHVSSSEFEGNSAGFGGGMYFSSKARTTVEASSFFNNRASEGAGLYLVGSDTFLTVKGSRVASNVATGSNGGGLFVGSGSAVLEDTTVASNEAIGAKFNVTSGACKVSGGCALSPGHPNDYPVSSQCDIAVLTAGVIDSTYFSTEFNYDKLRLIRNEADVATFSGTTGPDGLVVNAGDTLHFNSDATIAYPGFEVCYATTSNGGGIALRAGALQLTNVTLADNTATKGGGGLWMTNGVVTVTGGSMRGNAASEGDISVTFDSGTFVASALALAGGFSGVSAANAQCRSPCPAGSYGTCDVAAGAAACFVNCVCSSCPVGKASSLLAATSSAVCTSCGAGQIAPLKGATACVACPRGTFATDDPLDAGGGQARQVPKGASVCNGCPAGSYAASPSQIVCALCAGGAASAAGAANCTACPAGKYSTPGSSAGCADCAAGTFSASGGGGSGGGGASACLSCDAVGAGFTSPPGAAGCDLCRKGFFYQPAVTTSDTSASASRAAYAVDADCVPCSPDAACQVDSGAFLPAPAEGFWVATRGDVTLEDDESEEYGRRRTKRRRGRARRLGSGEDASPLPPYMTVTAPSGPALVSRTKLAVYRCPRLTCKGSSPEASPLCWASARSLALCDPTPLLCNKGASGPLCGHCEDRFVFSSTSRTCQACTEQLGPALATLFGFLLVGGLGLALYTGNLVVPRRLRRTWIIGALFSMDSGALRVLWSTYQIVESVSWTLDISLPSPFSEMLAALSFLSLDFLTLRCFTSSFFTNVIVWSAVPVLMELLCVVAYFGRIIRLQPINVLLKTQTTKNVEQTRIKRQHASFFIALSYLVVPPISRIQFQALDCVAIAGGSYLRVDTAVDCGSDAFKAFAALNGCFIALYLGVPLVWVLLLCGKRHRLVPPGFAGHALSSEATQAALERRASEPGLKPLEFLWSPYKLPHFCFEALEIYRRIFFVGCLPLLSSRTSRRAAIGLVAALASAEAFREVEPFLRRSTNLLAHVAQLVIALNFGAALAISTDLGRNISGLALGLILVAVNLVVVGAGLVFGLMRHRRDDALTEGWKNIISTQELDILNQVMMERRATSSGNIVRQRGGSAIEFCEAGGIALVEREAHTPATETFVAPRLAERVKAASTKAQPPPSSSLPPKSASSSQLQPELQPERPSNLKSSLAAAQATAPTLADYLLQPEELSFKKRVGRGAFGEVFRGKYKGNDVAVKIMLEVTEASVRAFRAEILLTATLRHPNIVSFVGACWGKELICLVLEWVPNGSLEGLLKADSQKALAGHGLEWDDPLLKLAIDVARGMAYLHSQTANTGDVPLASVAARSSARPSSLRVSSGGADRKLKCVCVLHRDIKPENVLVTDFLSGKVSDFGTSRTKAAQDVTMTSVGTPLYAAPEIFTGDEYDEAVDVYSFGLLLLAMAVDGPLLDFIGERWAASHGKSRPPKQAMVLINAMNHDGWRPISARTKGDDCDDEDGSGGGGGEEDFGDGEGRLSTNSESGGGPAGQNNGPPLAWAPRSVNALIVACCARDPAARPSFPSVLEALEGRCRDEIASRRVPFGRQPPLAAAAAAAHNARQGRVASAAAKQEPRRMFGQRKVAFAAAGPGPLPRGSQGSAADYPPDMGRASEAGVAGGENPMMARLHQGATTSNPVVSSEFSDV